MSLLFFGRNDAKAETQVLWPPHAKSWLIGKASDAGRDWGQEQKGTTEDEMAGWHRWLDGHEFVWTLGVGDGQGGLARCNSGVTKHQTRLSNWTELNHPMISLFPPSLSKDLTKIWEMTQIHINPFFYRRCRFKNFVSNLERQSFGETKLHL